MKKMAYFAVLAVLVLSFIHTQSGNSSTLGQVLGKIKTMMFWM